MAYVKCLGNNIRYVMFNSSNLEIEISRDLGGNAGLSFMLLVANHWLFPTTEAPPRPRCKRREEQEQARRARAD